MNKDLRIVFLGTPDFAVGILKSLIEAKHTIVGVITAPDRPAGRGRKLKHSAVKEYALSQGLPVLQPTNLKNEDFLASLKALQANLQIIVAFRMLPKVVWSMPEHGTFNLHASLLPQYRGAAPINWAIINGEKETGVTTFFIDEKIDTGAILLKSSVAIKENETVGSLHDTLMDLGSELVLKTVDTIAQGNVETFPQPLEGVLKDAPKLTPENMKIDWSQPGEKIVALIRGLSPYPVAWCQLTQDDQTNKVKIYAAEFEADSHKQNIGHIFTTKKTMKVAVINGYVLIKEMQLPGKRKMDIVSLLNGNDFSENAKMS
ncbi:methionyl-tRNA formyltransferase [unidentified eubacterium SCB49]|nr:methionyl-tRNA formyltransferase [unidentified eubacterium SCB49]